MCKFAYPHSAQQVVKLYTVLALCLGRLVGNIRSQGTVRRTVIRGRLGARPAGMRLPPPMSSPEAVPASKAAPTAVPDTSAATGKAGDEPAVQVTKAVQDQDKVCFTVHTWSLGYTISIAHNHFFVQVWVFGTFLSFGPVCTCPASGSHENQRMSSSVPFLHSAYVVSMAS